MAELLRRYSYASVPTIKRFSQSSAFIRGLMGPFGSGKSSGCIMELVKVAKRQHLVDGKRRARFACIRNTYQQLSDTTIKTFLHWLPDGVFVTYSKSEHVYRLNRARRPGRRGHVPRARPPRAGFQLALARIDRRLCERSTRDPLGRDQGAEGSRRSLPDARPRRRRGCRDHHGHQSAR